ncbi:hypothetical protein [Macrococcus sp. DPC7161]|uniref:hypothetical protein n=1 Tax=Macrococcus sp. DPC7161 TaxID=2507060 RepID=UPI00100ADC2F|nr:hypothetical protein [Macrococcus sp. DPC7161]RXK19101.1 hypothetical protein ER639_01950 [Macrococcus sp. DPC7161]
MIKRFIDRVENLGTEAWIAILNYIDTSIDDLNGKAKKNEQNIKDINERLDELTDGLGDVKAVIESNTELSKTIKKTALGGIVTIIIGYLAAKLGIVG